MPDDRIVYSFEGDITDLSAAVDQALALLDKFQKSGELYLQKFATATKNSTALRAFEANLKRTAAQIDAFKQSLAGVDPSAVGQLGAMSQAPIQTLSTVITTLQQNTNLTSAEFAALGTQLQTVQNELNMLTLAAQGDAQALQFLSIEMQAAAQQTTAATEAAREKMDVDN